MKNYLFGLFLLSGLVACDNTEGVKELVDSAKRVEMIVVNEGQFTKGSASLTAIYEDGIVENEVFRKVNGRPLGDVAQSISYINGLYYVVLNNSKKVEVIEPHTFKSVATINYDQQGSPRYITPLSDSEALVSDLGRQVVRINTKKFEVLEYISLNSSIEQMVTLGGKVFGCSGRDIVVFDTNKITQEGMRKVSGLEGSLFKTAKLVVDKSNKIWVMAQGQGKGLLHCIDPEQEAVIYTYEFPIIASSNTENYVEGCITGIASFPRIDTDRTKSKLYFDLRVLSNKKNVQVIYLFDMDTKEFKPYSNLLGMGMMYGMGVSPDGDIILCDCLDYSAQRGYIRQYKRNDEDIISRRVGIYPTMVHFTEYDK